MKMKDQIAWSLNLWTHLKLGGVWGIPRSGLIMAKTKTGFDLQSLAPVTDVQGSTDYWQKYRQEDFDCIAKRFTAAGLTFTDSQNLLQRKTLALPQ